MHLQCTLLNGVADSNTYGMFWINRYGGTNRVATIMNITGNITVQFNVNLLQYRHLANGNYTSNLSFFRVL